MRRHGFLLPSPDTPGAVHENLNQYRFSDVPPRVERTDGQIELFVTPMSEQARLMAEANALASDVMRSRVRAIDVELEENPTNRESLLEERLATESKLGRINNINIRLHGGMPDKKAEIGIRTNTVLGAAAIRQQTIQRTTSPAGEVQFDEEDLSLLTENLGLGAGDLRQKAGQASRLAAEAKQAKHELAEIEHADHALVWNLQANKMLALRSDMLAQYGQTIS